MPATPASARVTFIEEKKVVIGPDLMSGREGRSLEWITGMASVSLDFKGAAVKIEVVRKDGLVDWF